MAVIVAVALLSGSAGPAWAHGGGEIVSRGDEERALRSIEVEVLGAEHAAEHARQREAEREMVESWEALSPAEQELARADEDEEARSLAEAVAAVGAPDDIGQWTSAPFAIPNYAIHSAVLPTGKVLFWGYPPISGGARPNEGRAALWDPAKGTGPGSLRSIPPPQIDVDGDGDTEPAPIYCSGQSFLPNGALLATGGNLAFSSVPDDPYTSYPGHNRAFTFDPWSETWIQQPAMRKGRWYPSQVEMADGRTAILSGYSHEVPGGVYNQDLEIFTPSKSPSGVGRIDYKPLGQKALSTYPHLFSLPSGDVAVAGPDRYDTGILDAGSLTWSERPLAQRQRDASSAVLVPGGTKGSSQIVQLGGYDPNQPTGPDGSWPATETSEGINLAARAPTWTSRPALNLGRVSHNTVLLPDKSMVTVGGGRGYSDIDGSYLVHDDARLRQVELYDPATGSWRLGPAQQEDRAYHSTAVLLPDGRIMSAGDDLHPVPPEGGFSNSDTAEIYSPPYLFKGKRPKISRAPRAIDPGDSFKVSSPSPKIARAVLMAPNSTTHGFDMQQRHVALKRTGVTPGKGISVVAPPSNGVAPPGYYMLFLLNKKGVPSVAKWVRLNEACKKKQKGKKGAMAAKKKKCKKKKKKKKKKK